MGVESKQIGMVDTGAQVDNIFEPSVAILENYYSNGIPRPDNRVNFGEALSTASHESNHVFAALNLGYVPEVVSVVPSGDSLGRTVFTGSIDHESFKVIAAAGAVDTVFGRADGFGSDLSKINMMHYEYGGMNSDAARLKAGDIIGSVPKEIRERVAQILASMGQVSGLRFIEIVKLSELELNLGVESSISNKLEERYKNIISSDTYKSDLENGISTVVETKQLGLLVKIIKRAEDSELDVCINCRITGGHSENCISLTPEIEENEENEEDYTGVLLGYNPKRSDA